MYKNWHLTFWNCEQNLQNHRPTWQGEGWGGGVKNRNTVVPNNFFVASNICNSVPFQWSNSSSQHIGDKLFVHIFILIMALEVSHISSLASYIVGKVVNWPGTLTQSRNWQKIRQKPALPFTFATASGQSLLSGLWHNCQHVDEKLSMHFHCMNPSVAGLPSSCRGTSNLQVF